MGQLVVRSTPAKRIDTLAPGGSAQQEDPYISADWPIRREKETSAEYLYTTKVRKLVECCGREGTRDIVAQADSKQQICRANASGCVLGEGEKTCSMQS